MPARILAASVIALGLIGPSVAHDVAREAARDAARDTAGRDLIVNPQVCGRVGTALGAAPVADMVMVDGFGAGGFDIDAARPEAQAWFDHGVKLRWAFEHSESVRAFRKARALDPSCGMCAWGEAWAVGPNLNGGGTDDASLATGLAAALDARRLAVDATPVQREMIEALVQRYSGRKGRQAARFAQAMDRIAKGQPGDATLAAMAADAWMIKADDWWDAAGKAADPGITRAMVLLEGALSREPDHLAAIHLYIHLTEWSDDPHKAIPYGERLAALAPGASHLVHMPSHTFYRVGRYKDAMRSNVNAVALDRRYDRLAAPPGGVPAMRLHAHNLHFGMGGALMAGGGVEGLALADGFLSTYAAIPATNVFRQITANNAYALYGRFADQDTVAALKEPPQTHPLLRASWSYARGEAAARRGDASAVRIEAAAIRTLRAKTRFAGVNGRDQADFIELSQRVLEGRAAMIDGNAPAAIAAFARAAEIQASGEEGGDPPAIWYPTRRSLAAAMLAGGDAAGAKARIEQTLIDWPRDPYSLFVLAQAETALGNDAAARAALDRSREEWVGGAMSLTAA